MTTVNDVCTRALRKIGASDATPDGEAISEALDAYNDMLFAWKLFGADTEHVTQTLTDDFPLAAEYVEGTTYLLASRLSPNYELPQMFDADAWFRAIQNSLTVIDEATMPETLLTLPSQRRDWIS